MINSVGNKYTVWAQGLLRIPHKCSKCVCSTTYSGIAREQRKALSIFCILGSAWVLGGRRKKEGKKGYTNQAPRPQGWPPSCSLGSSWAGPLSFLVWAKLLPCIYCSLSLEDYFISLHLRTPTYSSPKIPLSQGCLPWTPTVSLPIRPFVCGLYHNHDLNVRCVILKVFLTGHRYYWHWGHVLSCPPAVVSMLHTIIGTWQMPKAYLWMKGDICTLATLSQSLTW